MTDPYIQHELVDRLAMAENLIDTMFSGHPSLVDNPEVAKLIEEAGMALANAYQIAGTAERSPDSELASLSAQVAAVVRRIGNIENFLVEKMKEEVRDGGF